MSMNTLHTETIMRVFVWDNNYNYYLNLLQTRARARDGWETVFRQLFMEIMLYYVYIFNRYRRFGSIGYGVSHGT